MRGYREAMHNRHRPNLIIALVTTAAVMLVGPPCFDVAALAQQATTNPVVVAPVHQPGNDVVTHPAETSEDTENLARAVAAEPNDLHAVARLIRAYTLTGRYAAAESVISTAAARFSGFAEFESAAALVDEHRQRWREAADRLRAIGPERGDDETLRLTAALRRLNRMDEASEELRRLIQRSPQNDDAWCAWVEDALERNRPAQALQRVQEAKAAGRSDPRLYCLAAHATFALKGAFGDATIRALPDARPGQFVDGWLVLEYAGPMGRTLCAPPDSAIALVRHALDEGVNDAACHLLHARIWHAAGRPESARAVIRSRPEDFWRTLDPRGLEHLIAICMDSGDIEAALTWSRTLADRIPARRNEIMAATYLAAADVYNQRGNADIHRDYLRRALELRPEDANVMLRLADADWECGDRERAVRAYRALLENLRSPAAESRILERLAEWQSAQTGAERR